MCASATRRISPPRCWPTQRDTTDRLPCFPRGSPADLSPNPLAAAVERMRLTGRAFADLTVSNPTEAGFDYPPSLLEPLSAAESLRYDPQPFGLSCARGGLRRLPPARPARARQSRRPHREAAAKATRCCSSCCATPATRCSMPTPSYPLFEHLTRLDSVQAPACAPECTAPGKSTWRTCAARSPTTTRAVLVRQPQQPDRRLAEARRAAGHRRAVRDAPPGAHR